MLCSATLWKYVISVKLQLLKGSKDRSIYIGLGRASLLKGEKISMIVYRYISRTVADFCYLWDIEQRVIIKKNRKGDAVPVSGGPLNRDQKENQAQFTLICITCYACADDELQTVFIENIIKTFCWFIK